jgi:hypothetical protein
LTAWFSSHDLCNGYFRLTKYEAWGCNGRMPLYTSLTLDLHIRLPSPSVYVGRKRLSALSDNSFTFAHSRQDKTHVKGRNLAA